MFSIFRFSMVLSMFAVSGWRDNSLKQKQQCEVPFHILKTTFIYMTGILFQTVDDWKVLLSVLTLYLPFFSPKSQMNLGIKEMWLHCSLNREIKNILR